MKEDIEITVVVWLDSFGALSGWIDLEDFNPDPLYCVSTGVNVFENEKIISLAPNYAKGTTFTPEQANGIMTIPKSCIVKISSFSFCPELGLKQLQPQT